MGFKGILSLFYFEKRHFKNRSYEHVIRKLWGFLAHKTKKHCFHALNLK